MESGKPTGQQVVIIGNGIAGITAARHIRKADAEMFHSPEGEGGASLQIDMVVDQEQVSFFIIQVYCSRGIGDQQFFHSEFLHHPHGESYVPQRIPLIDVKSPLHDDQVLSFQPAIDQLSFMEFDCCRREAGDMVVAYF